MTINLYKKEIVKEFVAELGKLLSIRISQYIRKFKQDDESKFLNEFIICPYQDDFDRGQIQYPANARKHFEEKLDVGFSYFELSGLSLTNEKFIEYSITCYPVFLEEDYEGDSLEFRLVKDKINFYDQSMIDFLEDYDDEIWKIIVRDVQKEISFGTLKRN
jgi:hypothetical protein